MKRVFIYCRKSSDREDRQILGADAQKRLLSEVAAARGFTVVDLYVEKKTAYKTGRPFFNEMLSRLEKGEADSILTYHLTRLARNSFDGGRIIYMMDEKIIREIITPEKVYTNNGDDKFMMQIHFAMAKKSSDDTSQFVTRDIESKLLKGEYPGMVPPGYLNINRDGHITKARDDTEKYMLLLKLDRPLKREEIDPIDGPIVRQFFEEASKGVLGLPQLRKLSFKMGLRAPKTGKMFSKHAVENLLTNPYYYGVIEYNGRIYDDIYIQEKTGDPRRSIQHESLITKELFDAVQFALTKRGKGRYRRHAFSFGGCILKCGECGGSVTAERQRDHVYYHCTHNNGPCSQTKWTRQEVMEKQFERILSGLRIPQSFLDFAFKKLRTVHVHEAQYTDAQRRKFQGQLNGCQQRLDGLLQLKISPNNADGSMLSDDEYIAQKKTIREEFEMVEKQLKTVQQQGLNWIDDCEHFFSFTQRLATKFQHTTIEDKKALLHLVCSNMRLTDQEVAADYREPYASLAGFAVARVSEISRFERDKELPEAKKSELFEDWLGKRDSNPRMTAPEAVALPLGDSPMHTRKREERVRILCLKARVCDTIGPQSTSSPDSLMAQQITVQTTVQAPLSKVWQLWTAPEHIMQWNNASPDWHTPRATNDLRTGGSFMSRMEAKDGSAGFDFGGTYSEVIDGKKIAYAMDDGRKVEVLFDENGGATTVTETFDAETENSPEMQKAGWQSILDNFKSYVEAH